MRIRINPSSLRQSGWREIAVRFACGGVITALIGMIAREFGPVLGGLFLAFPSIFPAASTLVERHVKNQQQRQGQPRGGSRARHVAALDAAGAAIGGAGLSAFAIVAWQLLPSLNAAAALALATVAWFALSTLLWWARKYA